MYDKFLILTLYLSFFVYLYRYWITIFILRSLRYINYFFSLLFLYFILIYLHLFYHRFITFCTYLVNSFLFAIWHHLSFLILSRNTLHNVTSLWYLERLCRCLLLMLLLIVDSSLFISLLFSPILKFNIYFHFIGFSLCSISDSCSFSYFLRDNIYIVR